MAIYTIQFKRGRASSWKVLNPVLAPGEPGYEIDTGKLKIGNGTDEWLDLKYVGENVSTIINTETHYDFPTIGDVNVLYKASQEKQLYQWNPISNEYEILLKNNLVTYDMLQEAIDKIEIPEIALEDYATKAYAQELIEEKMIALTTQEIHDICNKKE